MATPARGDHENQAGNCLVEPETGRLLAVDLQVAGWLGVDTESPDSCFLTRLLPALADEPWSSQWAVAGHERHTFETLAVRSDRTEFRAEVRISTLFGPEKNRLLVSIWPLNVPPALAPYRDPLTHLPDRRELATRRMQWQNQSSGKSVPHAVLFMDLDGFKQINDRHGHAVGDRVLTALASRWQRGVREEDLLVRYGGDEFVVLLAGIRSREEVEPILARLVAATAKPIEVDNLKLNVSVTIGVALADDTSADLDQLLAEADRAMYALKRGL